MPAVKNLMVRCGGDFSGLTNATKKASSGMASLHKSSNVLKQALRTLGLAFSAAAIIRFGKGCVEAASNLQEVQNVVDTTFGGLSNQINKFAASALEKFGLSETAVKKYTGTMGAMLKSMGLSTEAAAEMSASIAGLTGDMASFYNYGADEMFAKIRSGISGENEPLKQLGINMSVANLEAYALSKGIAKTYSSMTEAEKAVLRYNYLMDVTADVQGDFTRTSGSWANQTRLLTEQFNQLKTALGQGLIQALTPALTMLNSVMRALVNLANTFNAVTAAIFGKQTAVAAENADAVENAAQAQYDLADGITASGKAAKASTTSLDELNVFQNDAGTGSGDAVTGTGDGISTPVVADAPIEDTISPKLQAIVDRIRGMVDNAKLYIEQVVSALRPSASAWGKAFSSMRSAVEKAGRRIGSALKNVWDNSLAPFWSYLTKEWFPGIANTFSETFAPIFANVMPVAMDAWVTDFENKTLLISEYCAMLQGVFDGVKTVFSDMCASISENWGTYGESLLQGFSDFKSGLWETFWGIYDQIIKPVLDNCAKMFSWLWDNHLKPLWDNIVEFVMSLWDNILALWNGFLKPIVDWLIAYFAPIITKAINDIVDAVMLVVAGISDAIGSVLEVLDGVITFLVGVFTLDFERAWIGVKKIFEGVWDGMISIAKSAVNAIIWVLNEMISGIYTAIASVVNGMGSVVKTVGEMIGKEWGFSVPTDAPKIPYLAQGAVLPANKPFLAMVGDQKSGTNIEAPLATIQEAVHSVVAERDERMIAVLLELVGVAERIEQKDTSVTIGDETIGRANDRYMQNRGVRVNSGAFANTY